MSHSSIIPDKDLTCKIDFNGKQQQQTDRHTKTRARAQARTHTYVRKYHIVLTTKVISIIVQRGFCDLQFYGYTLYQQQQQQQWQQNADRKKVVVVTKATASTQIKRSLFFTLSMLHYVRKCEPHIFAHL